MPDLEDTIEDSDWELIEDEAQKLHSAITDWANTSRDRVKGLVVDLPKGCIGRSKEKWRPLKRVAVVAGGHWPTTTNRLIVQDLAEDATEREAGLKMQVPGVLLMQDLYTVWPNGENFVSTRDLVAKLVGHNSDYWGPNSSYGKALTETRLGRIVVQVSKVTSVRPGGRGPRGYLRTRLEPVWQRLRIAPSHGAGAPV